MKPADLLIISAAMPDCRLVIVPGIGHSMKSRSTGALCPLFGCLVRGFPNYRSLREE